MNSDEAAADAFGVLSDASRVAILRELADQSGASAERPVEFAELRRAVGVEDAGRFNYHLGKLTPDFAVKRDSGYVPTAVGLKAIGSIESGTYTDELEPVSGETGHDCPACGDPLVATYEEQVVTIECENHDTFVQTSVPPTVAEEADVGDIVSFVVGDIQRDLEALVDGACPMCSGPVQRAGHWRDDTGHLMVRVECENCWVATRLPVGAAAIRHPAVVALYYDHAIDVRDRFFTELEFVGSGADATLVSEDPFMVELTVAVGDDDVTLQVDDDLTVTEQ